MQVNLVENPEMKATSLQKQKNRIHTYQTQFLRVLL